MKRPVFNKTFFRFFIGFLAIIGVAFGVMIYVGSQVQSTPPVDNFAVPQ